MTDDNREDPWMRKAPPPRASAPPPAAGAGNGKPGWERDLLERLAFASLKEQRRARRWGIFFKAATLLYLVALLFLFNQDAWQDDGVVTGKHTALVDVRGVIADDQDANADTIVSGLRAAFKNKNSAGVIIRINSPGGSPVQAGYVNDEIARLRAKYPDKPIYAVVTDICASGGYYIAAAADKIYADKASLVGSIGVLMDGFGFVETMKKLGVERRLITAGENKAFMDPFSPQREEDRKHIQSMLNTIHQQFIDIVRKGRGDRLKESEELFSGLVWTGEQSMELGLIDGLGSSSYVAREIIGADKIVDYTDHRPYFERLVERLGSGIARAVAGMVKGSLQ